MTTRTIILLKVKRLTLAATLDLGKHIDENN